MMQHPALLSVLFYQYFSDEPSVNITTINKDQFFHLNENHTLDCQVQSVPLPNIINWYWQTSISPNCTMQPGQWKLVTFKETSHEAKAKLKQTTSADRKSYISHLTVLENRAGWYKCVGENKIGTNFDVVEYIASGNWYPIILICNICCCIKCAIICAVHLTCPKP